MSAFSIALDLLSPANLLSLLLRRSVNNPNTTVLGSFHGSEVPFVFYDAFELQGPGELDLSKAMVSKQAGNYPPRPRRDRTATHTANNEANWHTANSTPRG